MKMKQGLAFCILLSAGLISCQHQPVSEQSPAQKKEQLEAAAYYNTELGLEYLKKGNMPRAKRKLLQAQALNASSPDVNAALAYYFEKTNDMTTANTYYQKALRYSRYNGAQLNNYGAFLCRQHQFDKAESYFVKAAKDVNYLHTAGALENAGLCAQENHETDKAKNYFIQALSQDNQRTQSLYELVSIAIKDKQWDEAKSYLNKYPDGVRSDKSIQALADEIERSTT